MASGAILVGAAIFLVAFGAPPQKVGRYIFMGLSGLALLYCLAAGRRWTADCLSEEKREGTLGLLFLTDLKGYDVVVGKLAATSLSGFYGLLGLVPVLAVPLLLGGVSNAEFWRVVLVLVNTFLFSLAVGVCGSALCRDVRQAMATNFFLLLLLTGGPAACAATPLFFSRTPPFIAEWFLSCPVYSYYLCADMSYNAARAQFWLSTTVIQLFAWCLVLVSSVIAPRSWQDRPARTEKGGLRERWRALWRRWSFGRAAGQAAFRRQALAINAFYWLAARARLKPVHVWTFLGFMSAWWLAGWLSSGVMWFDESVAILTALLLNTTLKFWVAIEAGQQLAEDRKAGTLELLLSTPLTVGDIVGGQWLALRRQFFKPLALVIAVELLFMFSLYPHSQGPRIISLWLAGIVMLLADMCAVAWVAMFQALAAKNQHQAILKSVVQIFLLPWALYGLVAAVVNLWAMLPPANGWTPGWGFHLGLWFGLGLAADAAFGLRAWRRLHQGFRQLAMPHFAMERKRQSWWRRLARRSASESRPDQGAARRRPTMENRGGPAASVPQPSSVLPGTELPMGFPTRSQAKRAFGRKALVAGLAALGISASLLFLLPRPPSKFPPPLSVRMSANKAPLRVYPGGMGVLFILPDGSLWRWGQAGGRGLPRAVVPEPIGTNGNWVQVAEGGDHCAGLRSDGTVWEWGGPGVSRGNDPVRVDGGRDWIGVAAGTLHTVALRKDGTLWTWGNNSMSQLGIGFGLNPTNHVQIGTDHGWTAVTCQWGSTLALRGDGSLWTWGRFTSFRGGQPNALTFATPTRVCLETNWAGLMSGWWALAWTRTGELWEPLYGTPDAEAPAAAVGRRIITNGAPDRVAIAYCGRPTLFEVRRDGTLWARNCAVGASVDPPADDWHKVGQRSDWVSVWGSGGTALGLTRDGTVWTWGLDPSREPSADFVSKVRLAQAQIRSRFTGSGGGVRIGAAPSYQKEPRPLMRFEGETTRDRRQD